MSAPNQGMPTGTGEQVSPISQYMNNFASGLSEGDLQLSPGNVPNDLSSAWFDLDDTIDPALNLTSGNAGELPNVPAASTVPQADETTSADLMNGLAQIQNFNRQHIGSGNMESFIDRNLHVSNSDSSIDNGFMQNFPNPTFRDNIFSSSSGPGSVNGDYDNNRLGSIGPGPLTLNTSQQIMAGTHHSNHGQYPSNAHGPPQHQSSYAMGSASNASLYPTPSTDLSLHSQGPYYSLPAQQRLSQDYMQQTMTGYGAGSQQLMTGYNAGFQQPSYGYPGQLHIQQQQSYLPTGSGVQPFQSENQQFYSMYRPAQELTPYSQMPVYQNPSYLNANGDPMLYGSAPPSTGPTAPLMADPPQGKYATRLRSRKRQAQDHSESEESSGAESDSSDYSSTEKSREHKRRRGAGRSHQKSTEGATTDEKYKPELPKRDADKPWIRTNKTTKGLSTRTGKINNFKDDDTYEAVDNPFQSWPTNTGFTFEYDQWGGLIQPTRSRDAQSKISYTTQQIHQFIYQHPEDLERNKKLVLWIQQVPADASRRYPTEHGHTCRFDDCPEKNFKRNIRSGYYQVAFDEKWTTHGDSANPFHMAGYVHLYCLERFLDFPDICRRFDVRVDGRQAYPGEPKGEFTGSLLRKGTRGNEHGIASEFVKACKAGNLVMKYPDYPIHGLLLPGEPKNHKATLTYLMTKEKNDYVTPSKAAKNEARGLKPSFIEVNFGDLQARIDYMMGDQQRKADKAAQKALTATATTTAPAQGTEGAGMGVVVGSVAPVAQMTATPAPKSAGKKRKAETEVVVIDDDDEDASSGNSGRGSSGKRARKIKGKPRSGKAAGAA